MKRVENVGDDTRLNAGHAFTANDNESSFQPLSASSINSESTNFQSLIIMQIDRILYLKTFKLANCVFVYQTKNVALAFRSGLRSLESLLKNVLSEEYVVQVADVVQRLNHFKTEKRYAPLGERKVFLLDENVSAYLEACDEWFDLLVLEMQKIPGLLPTNRKDFEFQNSAGNVADGVEN